VNLNGGTPNSVNMNLSGLALADPRPSQLHSLATGRVRVARTRVTVLARIHLHLTRKSVQVQTESYQWFKSKGNFDLKLRLTEFGTGPGRIHKSHW
jgi:hypothetical protein